MALYAFDGTWNNEAQNDTVDDDTNVARFFEAYRKNSHTQRDVYVKGIGTKLGIAGRVIGGVFGAGELSRLFDTYHKLCSTYVDGNDHVIDIVGFSRGSATVLDFCNLLSSLGIRKPTATDGLADIFKEVGLDLLSHFKGTLGQKLDKRNVVEPRPKIRFVGLWDVVAAFGAAAVVPIQELNVGHRLVLPADMVTFCFHAMALDERRPSFSVTRVNGAHEVWFRGVHSDVGGGNGNKGLNDIGLKWMMSKAKTAGLPITDGDIAKLAPGPATMPKLKPLLTPQRVVQATDRCHHSVSPRPGCNNPPAGCPVETPADEVVATPVGAAGLGVEETT